MRRRRRRNKHWGLIFIVLALVTIVGVTLFLIHRGAKVQGPDQSNSQASTSVIDTTPTNSGAKTGTFTASGSAHDPDGESLKVTLLLHLESGQRYTRQLKIQGDTVRMIVDSGTFTQSGNKLSLTSTEAVVFLYRSKAKMTAQKPTRHTRYGDDDNAYPTYLTKVLNNKVTLKQNVATSYRYVKTTLSLTKTDETVPSLNQALDEQVSASSSSSYTATSSSTVESHADESSVDSTPASSSSAISSSSSSAADAASASSASITVEQAQALVDAQYPPSDYTSTPMGEQDGNFTFVVINNQTRENQTVTVTKDGTLQ